MGIGLRSTLAAGVVSNANYAAFANAIEGGGAVQLQFDGTINFESSITISADTILDASGHKVTFNANNSGRLFRVQPRTQLTLIQLTLSGGSNAMGGAVHVSGTLVASNCVFSRNVAAGVSGASGPAGATTPGVGGDGGTGEEGQEGLGGAIYNSGVARIIQCQFVNNKAAGGAGGSGGNGGNGSWRGGNGGHGANGAAGLGGAIYNASTLQVSNCAFFANTTVGGEGGAGGTNGSNTATSATPLIIRYPGGGGNGGTAAGGAIYSSGSLFTINSTFATNSAAAGNAAAHGGYINNGAAAEPGPDGGLALGGAIDNTGQAVLLQCTFFTNAASGGHAGDGGQGDMGGARGGNGGHGYGGQLDNAGMLTMTNCTLACGSATGGEPGNTTQTNLVYHTTGDPGEGRGANLSTRSGESRLANTILACPAAAQNAYGVINDVDHNLSSDKSCRFANSSSRNAVDPRLGPLADNGGYTLTMALLPGSPAIDSAAAVPSLRADQRGQRRPSGLGYDIGAFEVSSYEIKLTGITYQESQLEITAVGFPRLAHVAESSTDLVHWHGLATNQASATGTVSFMAPLDPNEVQRFYRLYHR